MPAAASNDHPPVPSGGRFRELDGRSVVVDAKDAAFLYDAALANLC